MVWFRLCMFLYPRSSGSDLLGHQSGVGSFVRVRLVMCRAGGNGAVPVHFVQGQLLKLFLAHTD